MENLLVPYQAEHHPGPGTALVLAPHPDDEVFGCAGAILRHCAAGEAVQVIIVSDGGFVGEALKDEQATYIQIRQEESRAAARVLGYGEPVFWGLVDRGIEYGEKLVRQILAAIEEGGVHRVYAPSVLEVHPDHRALGMAAAEAVRRSEVAQQLMLYEVGVPLRPTLLLDITDLMERKQAAMGCFASQLAVQEYDQHITALNRYRAYTLPREVKYAEAYWQVTAGSLRANPLGLYDSEFKRQHQLGFVTDASRLPLVSIIIRSMGRQVLSEALDSVALQTWPNIEVIVVAACGEGHPDIGEWCGRFPIRLVSTGEPLGRSQAANLGLEEARGRYINFLDDDDLFDPGHVAELVEVAGENYSVSYSGVQCIDSSGRLQPRIFNNVYDPVRILAGNEIPNNAFLFTSDLVGSGCRFDEALEYYEDWDFLLQLTRNARVTHLDKITARYRITENSGIGVHGASLIDQDLHFKKFFQKWREIWSDEEVVHLAALVRYNSELTLKLSQAQVQMSDMHEQISRVHEQLKDKDNLLMSKDLELTKCHQLLSAIETSYFWRITLPARTTITWIKRFVGRLLKN